MKKDQNRGETELYQKLTKQIQKNQHQASKTLLPLGFHEKKKGLFAAYIYTDPFNMRKHVKSSPRLKIPDTNAFVSFWTLDLLLEAFESDPAYLKDFHLKDAVENLMEFHDHTRAEDDPLFLFWKQKNVDGKWVSNAGNLAAAYPMWKVIDKSKDKLKKPFSKPLRSDCSGLSHPHHAPQRSSALFCLPADFDDSALNWAFGASLFQLRNAFPELWSAYSAKNFDFSKLARHAVEYSYRPFSDDKNVNAIDPRTFYAIREFLWDIQNKGYGTSEFMLLTTWASTTISNLDGIERHYKMPFNINNVDFSVSANFVYAALKNAFVGSFPKEVEGFSGLIKSTSEFLVWSIKSGTVVDKPDLLLLYYPSPYLGFFFVSRTVSLLQEPPLLVEGQTAELVQHVRGLLFPVARDKITEYLLSSVRYNGAYAFWAGPSLSADTPSVQQASSDRKFITALAVNTLINLWTIPKDTRLEWQNQTPKEVQPAIAKGVCWLREYAFSKKYPDKNAFFSSSVKHPDSLPFLFPANMLERSSAPVFHGKRSEKNVAHEGHSVFAMSGVPSREYYDQVLAEKGLLDVNSARFRKCYALEFPHWSAPSVVYALICCALTKAALLEI